MVWAFFDQIRLFAGWCWLLMAGEFFEDGEVNKLHDRCIVGIELDLQERCNGDMDAPQHQ